MGTTTSETHMLRIGAMAERTAVSERTLRYYEELGLLVPAGHSPGGSRRYSELEVARVLRIRELQQLLGFNLDEIRTVLSAEDRLEALRAAWHEHQDPDSRRRILTKGLEINTDLREEVAGKLERIQAFLAEVDEQLARNLRLQAELDDNDSYATPSGRPSTPAPRDRRPRH
jgi:DNA-binding transcriptional MerR regulator